MRCGTPLRVRALEADGGRAFQHEVGDPHTYGDVGREIFAVAQDARRSLSVESLERRRPFVGGLAREAREGRVPDVALADARGNLVREHFAGQRVAHAVGDDRNRGKTLARGGSRMLTRAETETRDAPVRQPQKQRRQRSGSVRRRPCAQEACRIVSTTARLARSPPSLLT